MTDGYIKPGSGMGLGLALGGICGMSAVITAAASSHIVGMSYLGIISDMMAMHAAAFIAIGVALSLTHSRLLAIGMLVIFLGLGLFCGDLASRTLFERSLFTNSAPFGGLLMVIGWLFVVFAGLARAFRR